MAGDGQEQEREGAIQMAAVTIEGNPGQPNGKPSSSSMI